MIHKQSTEDFITRVAAPNDEAAIENVLSASYPALMGNAYDPDTLTAVLPLITKANPSLLASGTYYVVESSSGMIIGCGGWTRVTPPGIDKATDGVGHLRHFGTHPQWIRCGVGKAIYQQCAATACAEQVRIFEVLSSLNAVAFYAALGFQRVREVVVTIGSGIEFPAILMRRELLRSA